MICQAIDVREQLEVHRIVKKFLPAGSFILNFIEKFCSVAVFSLKTI
jgi:hypothetical protein